MHRKPAIKEKVLAPLLVAMVVFMACAPVMSRMTCLMGGHSVVSLGPAIECCPEDHDAHGPVIEGECCAFSAVKLLEAEYVPSPEVTVDIPSTAGVAVGAPLRPSSAFRLVQGYPCRPPPRHLAVRLARLQVYLI